MDQNSSVSLLDSQSTPTLSSSSLCALLTRRLVDPLCSQAQTNLPQPRRTAKRPAPPRRPHMSAGPAHPPHSLSTTRDAPQPFHPPRRSNEVLLAPCPGPLMTRASGQTAHPPAAPDRPDPWRALARFPASPPVWMHHPHPPPMDPFGGKLCTMARWGTGYPQIPLVAPLPTSDLVRASGLVTTPRSDGSLASVYWHQRGELSILTDHLFSATLAGLGRALSRLGETVPRLTTRRRASPSATIDPEFPPLHHLAAPSPGSRPGQEKNHPGKADIFWTSAGCL